MRREEMELLWLVFCFVTSLSVTPAEKIGCEPTEFRCSSGQCVDSGRYCDGNSDCFDSSDEPERCTMFNIKSNNVKSFIHQLPTPRQQCFPISLLKWITHTAPISPIDFKKK
ncbi:hypothetical protein CDAR_45071 [Caerostris darwini]|uniref:Uncharacterized protein n=1 Tax=Caerostris darwini TaxID=1538125 RepID=A0AAV4UY82_9ARAC|nr:hypothetical protein CDAR_45071 [Caerostris darwini]